MFKSSSTFRHPVLDLTLLRTLPWLGFVLTLLFSTDLALAQPDLQAVMQPVAIVQRVDVVGTDAKVHVGTSCPIEIVLKSRRCGELGRAAYIPSIDNQVNYTAVVFSDALSSTFQCGPQYQVEIQGLSSTPPNHYFRTKLHCNALQLCDVETSQGVYTEALIPVSPELDQAMDEAAVSENLLEAMRLAYPSLSDEIDTYALHLGLLMEESGQSIDSNCSCQWTGVLARRGPLVPEALASPAQTSDNAFVDTGLLLKPRCQKLAQGDPLTFRTFDGKHLGSLPAIVSCPAPDAALAEYHLNVQGWATVGGTPGHPLTSHTLIELLAGEATVSSTLVAAERSEVETDPTSTETLTMSFGLPPASPPQSFEVITNSFATVMPPAASVSADKPRRLKPAAASSTTAASLPADLFARSGIFYSLRAIGLPIPSMAAGVIVVETGPSTQIDDIIDDGEH